MSNSAGTVCVRKYCPHAVLTSHWHVFIQFLHTSLVDRTPGTHCTAPL